MFDEDLEPHKKKTYSDNLAINLEPLSVEELRAYKEALKGEIKRVEEDIIRKQSYNDAAASIFKS